MLFRSGDGIHASASPKYAGEGAASVSDGAVLSRAGVGIAMSTATRRRPVSSSAAADCAASFSGNKLQEEREERRESRLGEHEVCVAAGAGIDSDRAWARSVSGSVGQ